MVRFKETEDFNEIKKLISDYVFEKISISYPPFLISEVFVEDDSPFKIATLEFEKLFETTLEYVDNFDSDYFFGEIYFRPVEDCCSVTEKDLIIFYKKTIKK